MASGRQPSPASWTGEINQLIDANRPGEQPTITARPASRRPPMWPNRSCGQACHGELVIRQQD